MEWIFDKFFCRHRLIKDRETFAYISERGDYCEWCVMGIAEGTAKDVDEANRLCKAILDITGWKNTFMK